MCLIKLTTMITLYDMVIISLYEIRSIGIKNIDLGHKLIENLENPIM